MNEKNNITIESDLFMDLRAAFNRVLNRTLHSMKSKDSNSAEITIKLNVLFNDEYQDGDENIIMPKFSHKITSISKFKDEENGRDSGEHVICYDDETETFTLKHINENQVSMDDEVTEETEEIKELPAESNEIPALEAAEPVENDNIEAIDVEYEDVETETEE